ncbi:MAG TPA: sugar phosphate isomerase/epimerase family protein [Bryobacteraceae bacterium]|nr:sugar phosphate isomerase/epimerase family protein [Bryobacteraceae bacterium]
MSRREFSLAAGLGFGALGTALGQQAPARRLKFGHTGITWRAPEDAIADIGRLGFWGFEPFGNVLEQWESREGGMGALLEKNNLPLISAYCGTTLQDPTKRADEVAKLVRWGNIIKKYGGTTVVIGPGGRGRNYDFKAAKDNIVASLNEICKQLADIGMIGALHQHTGTEVELHDEVYAVLESVDAKYVRFGPDVGQLQKGGSDPVQVLKDFLPLIRHVHFKDYNGGPYWTNYCPLGFGKVDLHAVLDVLESQPELKIAMVELDSGGRPPYTPLQTATMAKEYLSNLGYTFRS